MSNNTFMKVEEVAEILGISKSYAYKIVQKLNDELKEKGLRVDLEATTVKEATASILAALK